MSTYLIHMNEFLSKIREIQLIIFKNLVYQQKSNFECYCAYKSKHNTVNSTFLNITQQSTYDEGTSISPIKRTPKAFNNNKLRIKHIMRVQGKLDR